MTEKDQKELELRVTRAKADYLNTQVDQLLTELSGMNMSRGGISFNTQIYLENERRQNMNARLMLIERDVATQHRAEIREREAREAKARELQEGSAE